MDNFKRSVLISLIDEEFFTEFSHKQIRSIKPTINNTLVKSYAEYCNNLSFENSVKDNLLEIKNVFDNETYENICRSVICTTLDIFSYVIGNVIDWEEGNYNIIKDDKIVSFCTPRNMLYCDCADKLFKDIDSFNTFNCSNKLTKRVIRGMFK